MVATSPAVALATSGALRRSTTANGRCHKRSATSGPAIRSTSLPNRGPIPGSDVTWAKRGVRLCGRIRPVTWPLLPPICYAPFSGPPGEKMDEESELETRRKRLLYRSGYRGTKENDLLLGQLARAHIAGFDAPALD